MTTEKRLASLERSNKYMLIGLVVLAVGWAFTSTTQTVQAQADENIVRAEGFELVDAQGRVLASLDVLDMSMLLLLGIINDETEMDKLTAPDSMTALSLCDENGMPRAVLCETGLHLYDETLTSFLNLGMSYSGRPRLGMSYREGLISLGVFGSGPELEFYENNGRTIWSAP